jgi:hypothetical protein
MIKFSDALPIQIWPNGVPTYNQKPQPGVDKECWYQKWNAEDTVVIQFYDFADIGYRLDIVDKNDVLIVSRSIPKRFENGIFIFEDSFLWSDLGITNNIVRLKIMAVFSELTGVITNQLQSVSGSITNIIVDFELSGTITNSLQAIAATANNAIPYDLEALLVPFIPSISYNIAFSNGPETKSFSALGSFFETGILLPDGSGSVSASASKTNNGGVAQDAGTVVFYRNGVDVSNQSFTIGDVVSKAFTFTSLAAGDDLKIEVYEG